MTNIHILFEDADLLVINKPPELVINRSVTTPTGTLQDWLEHEYKVFDQQGSDWQSLVPADFQTEFGTPEAIFQERVGIVHRLDKDTSGALVIAKNPGSLVHLLGQFKHRKVTKRYQALVHGKFPIPEATVSFPMGRASHNRIQFAVTAGGREAVTKYKVNQFFPQLDVYKLMDRVRSQFGQPARTEDEVQNWLKHPLFPYLDKLTKSGSLEKLFSVYQGFSLIDCWPKTGRTHQIRVHMKHLHHPLVGDVVYVGKARQKLDRVWCPRHFLHAAELQFQHPRTGESLAFAAPLWPDLEQVLSLLVPV